jgi:hypothetical protein
VDLEPVKPAHYPLLNVDPATVWDERHAEYEQGLVPEQHTEVKVRTWYAQAPKHKKRHMQAMSWWGEVQFTKKGNQRTERAQGIQEKRRQKGNQTPGGKSAGRVALSN